jgi:signal transduction histidine kinase
MVRSQISSALKSVALHQEILQQTALHERSVQERLAAAERMNALSVLAGGVAHDLNNTLGPLVGLPDLILHQLRASSSGADNAGIRSDVMAIKTAALRAARTIKDLLVLGRQGRTEQELVDLNRVAASCFGTDVMVHQKAASGGVRVELEVYPAPLVIRASDAQLARAITNLLHNAVEAAPRGGRVVLRTGATRLLEPLSAHERIPAGDYALVAVSDTGTGIADTDLGRIFEPFFTRKRPSENSGSGLGLTIVHSVVKEHDGFVDVATEPGRGTTFTLYLRRAAEPVTTSGNGG